MKVEGLGEFGLLERIKPFLSAQAGEDDAALLEDGDGFVVASCDMFVEGVHFDLGWMSAEDAGGRSLALARRTGRALHHCCRTHRKPAPAPERSASGMGGGGHRPAWRISGRASRA